jgi:hypothetical protein
MKHFLIALFAAVAVTAHAAPERTEPAALSAEELMLAYLECDRRATAAFLDAGDAANCSLFYEELKQRVFGGDYDRLLAWWQRQRVAGMNTESRTARPRR